jgi:hypothetical protein
VAKKTLRNVGRMHRVNCDWCGLRMACSCFFALIDKPSEAHPLVLCPRCQVGEFLNLVFGRDQNARGSQV